MRVRRLRTLVCVLAMLFALAPIRAGRASDAVTQDEASELLDALCGNTKIPLTVVSYCERDFTF